MKILIVEDEFHTSALLKELIESDGDNEVVMTTTSISETVHYLHKFQNELDLCFMDIELSDGRSFEIFNNVDVHIPIIFCTAYEEFAMQAIKNNGIDYILKPIKDIDIHTALEKFKNWFHLQPNRKQNPIAFKSLSANSYQRVFLSNFRDETLIFKEHEIGAFFIKNGIVWLYTNQGEKYQIFKNLEHLENACDPNIFFRINRKMLVNREAILSFSATVTRKLILNLCIDLEHEVIVSRLKVSHFKIWLEKAK